MSDASELELIQGEGFHMRPGKNWDEFVEHTQTHNEDLGPEYSVAALGFHAGTLIMEQTGDIDNQFVRIIAGTFADRTQPPFTGEARSLFVENAVAVSGIRAATLLTTEGVKA